MFLTCLLCWPGVLHTESVEVEWNSNNEIDLAGYRVHYGNSSREYTNSIDTGNTTEYTVLGLQGGATYYFALTAYDYSGNESGYSDEIMETIEVGQGSDLIQSATNG